MKTLRWGCLAAGILVASQAWAGACKLLEYGAFPVEMVDGEATTVVKINGTDTRFALDTGAFFNSMSRANASALGLELKPAPVGYSISGVGGEAHVHFAVVKELGILDTKLDKVAFVVGGTDTGYGLLGANLLDIADLEADLAHGKLTLFKPDHCSKLGLAYWAKDGNYNVADIEPKAGEGDRRTFVRVTLNGRRLLALLDSGAFATVLSSYAAKRVGINLDAPGVHPGTSAIGMGGKSVRTWTVPIDSFSVGTETIQHSQMQVVEGGFGDSRTDMLLGVDFFLAHRMFIANSQGKIYFTYNGGRVFTLASAPGDSKEADAGHAADNAGAPANAADHALRGQAHLARGELKAALADMDAAIRMDPAHAAYYLVRARIHASRKQADAELADLDKSLDLDPKNVDALLLRADLRIDSGDRTGAAADAAAAKALVPAGSDQARTVAWLYVNLGQPAAALPILDEWIRLHPHDAMLGEELNERCWARSLSNLMLDDALRDCRKAIRRDGNDPDYLDSLGTVQLRLGHYAESIKAYEQALAQKPQNAWSRYGIGLARIRSGQTNAGNADLATARRLDPHIAERAGKYGLSAAPTITPTGTGGTH